MIYVLNLESTNKDYTDFPGFDIILTDSSTFYEVFVFSGDLDIDLFLRQEGHLYGNIKHPGFCATHPL